MVNIGNNKFERFVIPLIFEDRYFQFEEVDGNDCWTVFTLKDGEPIIEILRNEPKENPITTVETNPTGIITISDPESGNFLYKIRPGKNNSSIFGTIKGENAELKIKDRKIIYGEETDEKTMVLENNIIEGQVGIHIHKDGSFEIAAPLPDEIKKLKSGEEAATGLKEEVPTSFVIISIVVVVCVFIAIFFIQSDTDSSKEPPREIVYNNSLNGSVSQVKTWLNKNLVDPKSFEAIEWSKVIKANNGFIVRCKYRTKNSLGGYVINNQTFYMDSEGNVTDVRDYR